MTQEHTLSTEDAVKLGIQRHAEGRLEEAYKIYQDILAKHPNNIQTLHMLGLLAMQTCNEDAAKHLFQQVLSLDPSHTTALFHLGVMQRSSGEIEAAMTIFKKLLQINPANLEVRFELSVCLQKLNLLDEAIEQLRIILDKNPNHPMAVSNIVTIYMHCCRWKELEYFIPRVDRLNKEAIKHHRLPPEILSTNIARIDNLKINLQIAKAHSHDIERKLTSKLQFDFTSRKQPNKKLTIGYVCNNFNNHPTGHLMCGLFALHNRNKFNIIAYSYSKPDKVYYPVIKAGCDRMVNIIFMNDAQVAKQIYDDGVDILIDLKGHTPEARLGIFAYRPAPIQITYLGFPGTSGADFFDYMITDKVVTPPEHAQYYSEKFLYMPDCYQVNDSNQRIADIKYSRADFGLPEQGFVFSSFNQAYKIDPVIFDVWCRLLKNIPGSVLWQLKNNETAPENLKIEAKARGIDPDRIIFAEYDTNKAEHLARISLADLALDTRICGGHTTSSDTLWAGVPVVTMLGKHFASRVCSSLLTAIDMPELITHNLKEYEELCLNLAQNPAKLAAIKQKLAVNRLSKPLYNSKKFAERLEGGYLEAWNRYVDDNSTSSPIDA